MDTASLVLGLVGCVAWLLPLVGLPVTITGLVLGCKARDSGKKTAGIVLCTVFLIVTVINSAWGAYLGYTGQL